MLSPGRLLRLGGRSCADLQPACYGLPQRLISLSSWHAARQPGAEPRPFAHCTPRALHAAATPGAAPPVEGRGHGAIELVLGPMFAGKSSELLRRVRQYQSQGLAVAVIKSNTDNRYSEAHVVTHDGQQEPCYAVPSLAAFRCAVGEARYARFDVLAVDEAQFFPDLAEFAVQAADGDGKRLLLAGLDGDFRRRRFGQVLDLVPLADSVTKLAARCTYCEQAGRPAPALFSLRIVADGRQQVVGGAESYAPVCRWHYVRLSAATAAVQDVAPPNGKQGSAEEGLASGPGNGADSSKA